jgi:hypothetical protein
MPHDNRSIIADAPLTPAERKLPLFAAAAALLFGSGAAWFYATAGLTLSHYDARAHLVVARRIADSLTPGWKQIGAVWLPLPHIVNMPIVQWDWAYRTGLPSTALSILAMAVGLAGLTATVNRATRSWAAALAAPLLILANPNVLYLQSTPMTEPLLIGLSLAAVWAVARWLESDGGSSPLLPGLIIVGLALTRYEGWFVSAALTALSIVTLWRTRRWRAFALAPYLAGAIVSFLLLSKGSTGVWFVTSGFYVPDPALHHQPFEVIKRVWLGTVSLGGLALTLAGVAGAAAALVAWRNGRASTATILALTAAVSLPLYAFLQGHPFRIRYMVPLVVAFAALAPLAVARLPRRMHAVATLLIVAVSVWQRPTFDPRAAMVLEAQWETPYRLQREAVTDYLRREWDGTPILASMGSLGHYMQESSHAGFAIADFVHEGNGDLWARARERPAVYVKWMLIEERAEGGDELAARARRDERYLDGLERVAEGGGVALYRRR